MVDKQRQTKAAEQQEQATSQEPQEIYFFPNVDEGAPFSCEAASQEEAEQHNQQHLKQQKENR